LLKLTRTVFSAGAWAGLLVSVLMLMLCATAQAVPGGPVPKSPSCSVWYAIGGSPSSASIEAAAGRHDVAVLNAWETSAMEQLRRLNPGIRVLVYKDLASTRDYPGAVDHGVDAAFLPSGVGYAATDRAHPEWFALDNGGRRIEWSKSYPHHWLMAVWNTAYQQQWAANVAAEVVREGWDGVLADNDMATLGWYSNKLIQGTHTQEESDQRLRDGLDRLVDVAGSSLVGAGKAFVPNISERGLSPQRWANHARFGGGMDEHPTPRIESDSLCG